MILQLVFVPNLSRFRLASWWDLSSRAFVSASTLPRSRAICSARWWLSLSLASINAISHLRSALCSASFSLRSTSSSRSDWTMESRDPMGCMSSLINDELLMLNDELDVVIVFQSLRFHLFNFNTWLFKGSINNALGSVALIERFKLSPFRYRHTFGIVQASLTLLSLNAMFLLS